MPIIKFCLPELMFYFVIVNISWKRSDVSLFFIPITPSSTIRQYTFEGALVSSTSFRADPDKNKPIFIPRF